MSANSGLPFDRNSIAAFFQGLQEDICRKLEEADGGGQFVEDLWVREGGGGGRTRVLNGAIIEKGGVAFSAVHGELPAAAAKALQMDGGAFYATGVSLVLHPHNPLAPIVHMNVRYFESGQEWWFGGGIDLTPHYIDPVEAATFHQGLAAVCAPFGEKWYPEFKAWADQYFYLPHRRETRGVGGIFFDRFNTQSSQLPAAEVFGLVKAVGRAFCDIYIPLLTQKAHLPFTEVQKNWQYLRRGRYVEFNLVWDRGTKFGLETGGRTESILMSLPPMAQWQYNFVPEPHSVEAETLAWLRPGVDWLAMASTPTDKGL